MQARNKSSQYISSRWDIHTWELSIKKLLVMNRINQDFRTTTLETTILPFTPPAMMITSSYWKCLFTCDSGTSCMLICFSLWFSGFELWFEPVCPARVCVWCTCCSYIRAERRVQHVGLQPFKVDVSEDGVLLDLDGPTTLATQSLLGVLRQELTRNRRKTERGSLLSQQALVDKWELNMF